MQVAEGEEEELVKQLVTLVKLQLVSTQLEKRVQRHLGRASC